MTAIEVQPTQDATSNPDSYTGLPIFIVNSVFDRAARKFEHHFASAISDFKRHRKGPLMRQLWKEFRDAVPNETAGNDRAFVSILADKFTKPDGSVPPFLFRQNGDLLFVCIENKERGLLVVIYPAKADPITGRPVLERQPSQFAKGTAR
jgi:hypothetical protein